MMRKGAVIWVLICLFLSGWFSLGLAGGLIGNLGEVLVENLYVGKTYSLKDLANVTLIVSNSNDDSIRLKMDILIPQPHQLRRGAEPIPDPSWVTLNRDSFDLGPGEYANADISISIPDDKAYLGKKYQFFIWSHMLPRPGKMFSAAVASRIIFSISERPYIYEEPFSSPIQPASIILEPSEIFVYKVTPGERFNVLHKTGNKLSISNNSDIELTYVLKSHTDSAAVNPALKGWEPAPNPDFLSFSQDTLKIPPNSKMSVNLFLSFPKGEIFWGKKYVFVIHGHTIGQKVTAGAYSRVYVHVPEQKKTTNVKKKS